MNRCIKGEHRLKTGELTDLKMRVSKLEQRSFDEYVTLLEILSNATFFGDMKKGTCEHAKNGQCTLFVLKKEATDRKVPVVTKCKVSECEQKSDHYHFDTSNVTCSLCPGWKADLKRKL